MNVAEATINHNQEWLRFEPLPFRNNTNSIQPSVKSVKIWCTKQLIANTQTILIRSKGRKSTSGQKTWNTWKLLWQLFGTVAHQFFHWIYAFISFLLPLSPDYITGFINHRYDNLIYFSANRAELMALCTHSLTFTAVR